MSQTPRLRAGFEGSGSPRWLMRTLQTAGLDRAHGFALDLVLLAEGAHRHGTLQALADGRVDVVDADLQALAAAQADGLPVVAVHPYGRILGSLVAGRHWSERESATVAGPAAVAASVATASTAATSTSATTATTATSATIATAIAANLAALRGRRLGVLSQADKNWRLLAAAGERLAAIDLDTAVTSVVFATRAELVAALAVGDVDAALVHWHLVPALLAQGHRLLADLPALADLMPGAAGLPATPSAPTTYFVVRASFAAEQPAQVAALVAATIAAAQRLRADDAAWRALAGEGALAVDAAAPDNLLRALRTRWDERVGRFLATPEASPLASRSIPCNPY